MTCPRPRAPQKAAALVNILQLREGERVQSVLATRDYSEGRYLLFATPLAAIVKKTEFAAYNTTDQRRGIIAIKIRD